MSVSVPTAHTLGPTAFGQDGFHAVGSESWASVRGRHVKHGLVASFA